MSDVSTTDEWAKRLVERLRQNPLRRTRGARDFAELEDEIDRLHAENTALRAAVERVRAACENDLRWVDAQPILRALEEAP